jgi:acyl-CoA synthetase (AMP-forming)/AMP-acid ligase II
MFHLADFTMSMASFIRGNTHAIIPAYSPEAVMEAIQQHRISDILLIPTMIQMLVDHPALADYDLTSLERTIYGASPISQAVLERAMTALPQARFAQAYGQTELSPLCSVLGFEHHTAAGLTSGKLRSAGRPTYCVEAKIVHADGDEVPRGSVGEIAVRGPNVMLGYWKKPEATAAVLGSGWLRTGDGAYMDEEGFIFIVDRMKDMIVSGGENVYSAEVENAVARHPGVAQCAVIGIPSEQWGEAVHAVVVPKPGADLRGDDIKIHCHELIAGYKCPRSVEIVEALPLSGAGKVLKTVLREPFWKNSERRIA